MSDGIYFIVYIYFIPSGIECLRVSRSRRTGDNNARTNVFSPWLELEKQHKCVDGKQKCTDKTVGDWILQDGLQYSQPQAIMKWFFFLFLLSLFFQMFHKVGVSEGNLRQPTYVYPEEVKVLIRSVFPQNVCDYPDPCHDQVSLSTFQNSLCLWCHFNYVWRIREREK